MAVAHRSEPVAAVLTAARVRLAAEVVATYARVRWVVWRCDEVAAVAALRRGLEEPAADEPDKARILGGLRIGRAVVRVLRVLPTDSRCLMQSLVVTAMLARRGVYTTVVVGVRPDPSFAAHAWVEVDGYPLLATDEAYKRLVEF